MGSVWRWAFGVAGTAAAILLWSSLSRTRTEILLQVLITLAEQIERLICGRVGGKTSQRRERTKDRVRSSVAAKKISLYLIRRRDLRNLV